MTTPRRLSLLGLVRANMLRRPARTLSLAGVVALLAFVLIGGSLLTGSLSNGASTLAARLGADALIVPAGYEYDMEGVLLRGEPSSFYIEGELAQRLARIEGIEQASPQLFIATFASDHCSFPVQMIGYDPQTDFVISPWLLRSLPAGLSDGEVVVGSNIDGDIGDTLLFFGRDYLVAGKLEATGTGFDTSVFVNLVTAYVALDDYVALGGIMNVPTPVEGEAGAVSSIAVRIEPGYDRASFTRSIRAGFRDEGVGVVLTQRILGSVTGGLDVLLGITAVLIALLWLLATGVLALLFSVTLGERRREFGVYRALGATRRRLALIVLAESVLVSLAGALVGAAVLCLVYFSFSPLIGISVEMPYLQPAPRTIALLLGAGVLAATVTGPLAALLSAARIGRQATAAILKAGE
jgi:putative ABC transport system permease protein